MYYPFKKQINETYNIFNSNEGNKYSPSLTLLKNAFIIFVKITLLMILIFLSYSIINIIKYSIIVSKYNHASKQLEAQFSYVFQILDSYTSLSKLNIQNDLNDILNYLNQLPDLNELNIDDYGIISSIIQSAIDILINKILVIILSLLSNGFQDAFSLLNKPVQPILSDAYQNYADASKIFMDLGIKLDVLSAVVGAIPFIGGAGEGIGELANEMFMLSPIIMNKYNESVVPLINESVNSWNSIVLPISGILDSFVQVIFLLTGFSLFIPILTSSVDSTFGLPIYFWLSFMISIIFMLLILFGQLLSIAKSNGQKERQKLGKNMIGGFTMTIASMIFIPLLFITSSSIIVVLISKTFAVSGYMDMQSFSLSRTLMNNSMLNGATIVPPGIDIADWDIPSYPYGYLDGTTIILTSTYFAFSTFSVYASLIAASLIVITCLLIYKMLVLLHLLVIAPITNAFFIKDSGLSFRNWYRKTLSIFSEILLIAVQFCLLLIFSDNINYILNDILSYNKYITLTLLLSITISLTISLLTMHTSIKDIFTSRKSVDARIDKNDLSGAQIDSHISNRELNVSDKKLNKVIKEVNAKEMKFREKQIKNENINFKEIKKELSTNISNMNLVNSKNIDKLMGGK